MHKDCETPHSVSTCTLTGSCATISNNSVAPTVWTSLQVFRHPPPACTIHTHFHLWHYTFKSSRAQRKKNSSMLTSRTTRQAFCLARPRGLHQPLTRREHLHCLFRVFFAVLAGPRDPVGKALWGLDSDAFSHGVSNIVVVMVRGS